MVVVVVVGVVVVVMVAVVLGVVGIPAGTASKAPMKQLRNHAIVNFASVELCSFNPLQLCVGSDSLALQSSIQTQEGPAPPTHPHRPARTITQSLIIHPN